MSFDDERTTAVARALLPLLCPGYENCPGDVFDAEAEHAIIFKYQRELCLAAARIATAVIDARTPQPRDIAVAVIDGVCGYTSERAPNPAMHTQLYDEAEARIRELQTEPGRANEL